MKVEDTFGLEKFEECRADKDAERGKNAESIGIFGLEAGGCVEVGFVAGMENNVAMLTQDGESGVGERAVTEEDDLRARASGILRIRGRIRLVGVLRLRSRAGLVGVLGHASPRGRV